MHLKLFGTLVSLALLAVGCSLVRVNGRPLGEANAPSAGAPGPSAQSPAPPPGPGQAPAPVHAARPPSRDDQLAAAIAAKDLEGIRKGWTVGYSFNPRRPEVAVALFELDLETLATLLLGDNCFLGCEDLQHIDERFGTERAVRAVKGLLQTHAFTEAKDNIIAQKLGMYLSAHHAFDREACDAYVRILDRDQMTVGPLTQLGTAKCVVPSKTLTHFLISDDWDERRLAAWVAGEGRVKAVVPLLEKLAARDQYLDEHTLRYAVRDEASQALNKIAFAP